MPARRPTLVQIAGAAIVLSSPILTHLVLTSGRPGLLAHALVLCQSVAAIWLVARRTRPPYRLPALLVLVLCLAVIWYGHVMGGLMLSAGLIHAAANAGLLVLFASTLAPGREPIVTYFARAIHETPAPTIERYTRSVTWAWCAFFMCQLAASAALFAFAPVSWWSVFVNVLNLPLIVFFFLAEYFTRRLWLANPPREDFADMLHIVGLFRANVAKGGGGAP